MDWILFTEIEELIRDDGSANAREDAILWAVKFCDDGVLLPGDYRINDHYKWGERGQELASKIRGWLDSTPDDPLGPPMNLMFELTEHGRSFIPRQDQF